MARIAPGKPRRITSAFGVHRSVGTSPHIGVDYSGWLNTKVYAPEDGKVTLRYNSPTAGNYVTLYADGRRHRFLHLSQFKVKHNQQVKEGDLIGIMGATGNVTGRHLHWDLKVNNKYIDPVKWAKGDDVKATKSDVKRLYKQLLHRKADPNGLKHYTGRKFYDVWESIWKSRERADVVKREQKQDELRSQQAEVIKELQNELKIAKSSTKEDLQKALDKADKLSAVVSDLEAKIVRQKAELEELRASQPTLQDKVSDIIFTIKEFFRG